jgi:hypothetical protein
VLGADEDHPPPSADQGRCQQGCLNALRSRHQRWRFLVVPNVHASMLPAQFTVETTRDRPRILLPE